MKKLALLNVVFGILLFSGVASAQSEAFNKLKPNQSAAYVNLVAYNEQVKSELKNLLVNFTETYAGVKNKQFELEITQQEMAKILITPENKLPILNDSYGQLIIQKIKAETALQDSLSKYTLTSFEVNEKSSKLQAIETATAKISSN